MGLHRIFDPAAGDRTLQPGARLTIHGDEAHHAARVKRLEPGDGVEVLDGAGGAIVARVAGITKIARAQAAGAWALELTVENTRHEKPPTPRLEVWCPAPKGDRLEQMIDQLSQVGASAWVPITTARTVVEPRETKIERLRRVAVEALKQSGRPWLLEFGALSPLTDALAGETVGARTMLVLADAAGVAAPSVPDGVGVVRVIVGPEGGLSDQERRAALDAGAVPVALGPHVLRIETAAVAAAARLWAAVQAR